MARQVAILHGWSDTSDSFKPLARFLKKHGYSAVPVWLGDYRSLDDDVKIEDVAKRLDAVVIGLKDKGKLKFPFDLIVHSTGGLVARRWLAEYYGEMNKTPPIEKLLMLAPANHGSQLAVKGKSFIGRIFKGWNNGFETGTEMLNSLELSSPFQWDLVNRDIFSRPGAGKSIYGFGKGVVAPFVITGSHPYTNMRKLVSERGGTDGTVRVCAANMNAYGAVVDFTNMVSSGNGVKEPYTSVIRPRHGKTNFPLAVLPDRDHASIINPADEGKDGISNSPVDEVAAKLGDLILEALKCNSANTYDDIAERWGRGTPSGDTGDGLTERTASLVEDSNTRKHILGSNDQDLSNFFHQYFQINISVIDDHGDPVPDYFLEFFGGQRLAGPAQIFHNDVLEHVHTNKLDASKRTFYIDRYDLLHKFYATGPDHLKATVSAAKPGPNVAYFEHGSMTAKGEFTVHHAAKAFAKKRFLKRNSTHYVTIVIPRVPSNDVFRMKPA